MKTHSEILLFVAKAFLAGVTIGFGCVVYVVTGGVLGAFLFSLALLTVIVQGMYLYTGKIGYVADCRQLSLMLPMVILNFIGIAALSWMMRYTSLDFTAVHSIVEKKMAMTDVSSFILAICCGCMMYIAVDNYAKARNPLFVVMPIMLFILCGFEHCIADVGYFVLAAEPISGTMIWKTCLYIIGNAVGSLIFSKLNLSIDKKENANN